MQRQTIVDMARIICELEDIIGEQSHSIEAMNEELVFFRAGDQEQSPNGISEDVEKLRGYAASLEEKIKSLEEDKADLKAQLVEAQENASEVQ